MWIKHKNQSFKILGYNIHKVTDEHYELWATRHSTSSNNNTGVGTIKIAEGSYEEVLERKEALDYIIDSHKKMFEM